MVRQQVVLAGLLMNKFLALMRDESAATAIEYGLVVVLISLAALAAMKQFGLFVTNTFNSVSNNINR